jgi:S1-C subfamily serine protease
VKLVVLRGTTNFPLSITPVEQKSGLDSVANLADVEKSRVADLGILGVEIDPRMVDAASGLREPYGIVVAARAAGARSEIPLLPRDVIRSLNNKKIYTLNQLRTTVQELERGSPVTLQVQRDGRLMFLSFTLE